MLSLKIYVSLLLLVPYSSSSLFESLFDDTEDCNEFCSNNKNPDACERGCRLYSIMNLMTSDEDNSTLNACYSSCVEAYDDKALSSGCRGGCNEQKITSATIKEKEEEEEEFGSLTPLSHVYSMYSSLMGNVQRVMSVSWSVYVQDEDGRVIVVESPPQEPQQMLLSQPKQKEPLSLAVESRPETVEEESSSNSDFLDCLSLRSGLPRWFLALSIFFSAMVMIWLCFATTVTAPEQHVKQRLGVKSDLEYLKLADLPEEEMSPKLKLHPDDKEMAPPLPIKIKMEKV